MLCLSGRMNLAISKLLWYANLRKILDNCSLLKPLDLMLWKSILLLEIKRSKVEQILQNLTIWPYTVFNPMCWLMLLEISQYLFIWKLNLSVLLKTFVIRVLFWIQISRSRNSQWEPSCVFSNWRNDPYMHLILLSKNLSLNTRMSSMYLTAVKRRMLLAFIYMYSIIVKVKSAKSGLLFEPMGKLANRFWNKGSFAKQSPLKHRSLKPITNGLINLLASDGLYGILVAVLITVGELELSFSSAKVRLRDHVYLFYNVVRVTDFLVWVYSVYSVPAQYPKTLRGCP